MYFQNGNFKLTLLTMETLQVQVHNKNAKKILDELAGLKLISIKDEGELFTLTSQQKKSIATSRKQIKAGKFKTNEVMLKEMKKWLKGR